MFLIYFSSYNYCRIQPVYVVDVASALTTALKDDGTSMGKTYELGGPEIFTIHELVITDFILAFVHILSTRSLLLGKNFEENSEMISDRKRRKLRKSYLYV